VAVSDYFDDVFTPEEEQALKDERLLSDVRGESVYLAEAHAENYERDWQQAIRDHDWFCNQCDGRDQFGARCLNRRGHRGRHGATGNDMLKFLYSPEKIQSMVYESNPLLEMVRRVVIHE